MMTHTHQPRLRILAFCRNILLVFAGAAALPAAVAEPVRMTFLSPESDDSGFWFWNKATRFMRAVAEDLDVEFDVVASRGASTYAVKKEGQAILNRAEPPDYILTGYWNEAVGDLMEAADKRGVNVFLFNAPVMEEDKDRIQQPRARLEHWIGQMTPDETGAGYRLGALLLEHAAELEVNAGRDTIETAALVANQRSSVSRARETGFRRAVRGAGAVLNAVAATSWQLSSAEKAAADILDQYPDTTVIWSISDGVALTAIDVLKDRDLEPGVDAVTGGFDWSEDGITAVRHGEMAATMGGHFTEGGWAMILAYDHHHGHDFADTLGTTIHSPMQAITADNVDRYAGLVHDSNLEQMDFAKLSKARNPERDAYDFSIDGLLSRLND